MIEFEQRLNAFGKVSKLPYFAIYNYLFVIAYCIRNMAVFSLQDRKSSALLLGGSRCVSELALRLKEKDISFTIYIPYDDPALFAIGNSPVVPVHMIPVSSNIVHQVSDIRIVPDFIIECQPTPADHKVSLIQEVTEEFPQAIVMASTVACTATELMSYLNDSHPVIGFSCLPGHTAGAGLTEIARALQTSDQAAEAAIRFLASAGYSTEIVEDRVGLVMPRILATLMNEAAYAFMEKVASAADIDTAMKTGTNYPYGLLEWADTIGLDTLLLILEALYHEYRQERYRPCVLLRQYCRARWLGKSTGRGFYQYASGYR
jgi:3-hydroxybutyryl-CoA dehydrogenase